MMLIQPLPDSHRQYGFREGRASYLLPVRLPLVRRQVGRRAGVREGRLCQLMNRRDGILVQRREDGLLLISVQRLHVACCLGLRKNAKDEGFSGDGEIGTQLIDEWQKYSARRPPLAVRSFMDSMTVNQPRRLVISVGSSFQSRWSLVHGCSTAWDAENRAFAAAPRR